MIRGALETTGPVITLRVTSDLKKLWSCGKLAAENPLSIGRAPRQMGQLVKGRRLKDRPRNAGACDAKRFWLVEGPTFEQRNAWACEHQLEPFEVLTGGKKR